MILVTVGTQDKSFERLLKEIDRLIEKKIIKEEVVVQAGVTKYESKNMKIFDLIPKDEFEELIKKSRFIITHAGVGTVLTGLNNNKKIIAVSRLKKFNEHVNDHQTELVKYFAGNGYILGVNNIKDLESRIKEVDKFKPKKFPSKQKEMLKGLEKELDNSKRRKVRVNTRLSLFFIIIIGILILLLK